MTVQHVHVAEGGQAVIGNVSTPNSGGRGVRENEGTTPCIGLCTRRRDATPNRSGAGYGAKLGPANQGPNRFASSSASVIAIIAALPWSRDSRRETAEPQQAQPSDQTRAPAT